MQWVESRGSSYAKLLVTVPVNPSGRVWQLTVICPVVRGFSFTLLGSGVGGGGECINIDCCERWQAVWTLFWLICALWMLALMLVIVFCAPTTLITVCQRADRSLADCGLSAWRSDRSLADCGLSAWRSDRSPAKTLTCLHDVLTGL